MSEPRCERFRQLISAQLDERLVPELEAELDRHVAGCAGCRAFQASQQTLRRTLRLAPIEHSPDVTARVMARVKDDQGSRVREMRFRLAGVAAVAAALVVLASSLPVLEPAPQIAQAADVTRLAYESAAELDTYRATFDVRERGWHPAIPERRFSAIVWYRAPEEFRLEVSDRTDYPVGTWPHNDIEVISSATRSWIREPYACPTQALPGCAIEAGVEERTLLRRQPFDGTTMAPTDIVVPLETLAASDALTVVGGGRVQDRNALHVELTYGQAFPLVDALRQGGSWVPLLPLDRVDIWLDRQTWFPLRYEVTRAGQADPLLEVSATGFRQPGALPNRLFDAPRGGVVRNGGFTPALLPERVRGLLPEYTAGLQHYRSGTNGRRFIASFSDGLKFLKITFDRGSALPDIDQATAVVRVDDQSVGYYRPAAPRLPRRIELFGIHTHARVETNLRREQLIRVAGSIPLRGRAPRVTKAGGNLVKRLSPAELAQIEPALDVVSIPGGYRAVGGWSSLGVKGRELAVFYLPSQTALEGSEIRIFRSSRIRRLPPTSEDMTGVDVNGSSARWSAERGELEWIDARGIYRAVKAPSLDLVSVIRLAQEISPR